MMGPLLVNGLGPMFLPNKKQYLHLEKRFENENTDLTFIWIVQKKFTKNIEIWMPKHVGQH